MESSDFFSGLWQSAKETVSDVWDGYVENEKADFMSRFVRADETTETHYQTALPSEAGVPVKNSETAPESLERKDLPFNIGGLNWTMIGALVGIAGFVYMVAKK